MEAHIATVSQINGYLKKVFDINPILNNIWIKGEISNFKAHYSGHLYLSLKDENSVMRAVMFKSAASSLTFAPEDGMKVLARGRISIYEASGQYQLYIEEMTPDGVGDLYAAYEKLKKKLAEEGLFEEGYKKPIPKYPKTVGVVTATTGAAVRDIINVISRRFPLAEIIIYPTLVQGAGAAPNIVEAIEYFNREKCADTLIVGRGGGSIEDLWAFNEEIVARAIFASEIPIISAVGHETDFTIADFVADLRAPTPSAAAELAVPSQTELTGMLSVMKNRMTNAVIKQNETRRLRLKGLTVPHPRDKIQEKYLRVDSVMKSAEQCIKVKILEKRRRFASLVSALDAMSPLAVITRGYAIAMDDNKNAIRSEKELAVGTEFDLRLCDGTARCKRIK